VIRDLTMFKGPPDPLRGDEIYRRVREAAKECIEAVYEASNDVSNNTAGNSLGVQMQGIGGEGNAFGAHNNNPNGMNNNYNNNNNNNNPSQLPPSNLTHQGHHTTQSASGMQGIGSHPMPHYNNDDRSFADKARDAAQNAAKGIKQIIKDPLAKNIGGGGRQQQQQQPNNYNNQMNMPPGRNEVMQRTGGEWSMASNRGGNNSVASRQREPPAANGAFSWANPGSGSGGGGGGGGGGGNNNFGNIQQQHQQHVSAGTAISNRDYERSLIQVITQPAGFKPANIPAEEMTEFLSVVFNLNPDIVCPILLDVISGEGSNGADSNKRIKGLKVSERSER